MSRQTKYLNALALACALSLPLFVQAHEGHDDATPALSGDSPRRQSDGSVFIPKSAQRQLGLRTLAVAAGEHARAFELAGTVVMDPNAGGKVQAALAGRLEAGPQGLPLPGQSVKKGQVLAYVVPTAGALERSGQLAQQAELRAAKELAQRRLARLRELADTVARKDIEAAESELQSLTARLAAVGAGLQQRDALVAPVSGVIASSNAVAGQVLDAREQVFEVVDPARLRIEALAYDTALAHSVAGATLAVGGQRVPLRFLGAARSLRDQAQPLQFAGDSAALGTLALGQPVRVFVQSTDKVDGVQVPAAALLRNPANQTIVWVKEAPERFAPRVVTAVPLDGTSVAITSGLQPGDRVATQGATLINQVR